MKFSKLGKKTIASFLIIALVPFVYIADFYSEYLCTPVEHAIYYIPRPKRDTLLIAFIGDSWASMHVFHNCQIGYNIGLALQRPVSVKSYGINGATSKNIYEKLFDEKHLKPFLLNGFDYCIISAGINDTNWKTSPTYYLKSMDYILRFLTASNIWPIILEIPDYDIEGDYKASKPHRKLQRWITMQITGTKTDCKQQFRDSLTQLINRSPYKKRISIINYKEWNRNYCNDLKLLYQKDGTHLNETGYAKLDSCITQHIIMIEKQNGNIRKETDTSIIAIKNLISEGKFSK